MSDALLLPAAAFEPRDAEADADTEATDAVALRLQRGAGELSGRLAAALGPEHPGHGFLAGLAAVAAATRPAPPSGPHPIDRLAGVLRLSAAELDLLVLAGLPEEHEGLAALLRDLHPLGHPLATAGLAAVLAEAGLLPGLPAGGGGRRGLRRLLTGSAAVRSGALRLPEAAGGFWERGLVLADGLWSALHGEPGWPAEVTPLPLPDRPAVVLPITASPAVRAVAAGEPVLVAATGADVDAAATAAAGVLARAAIPAVALHCGPAADPAAAWLAAVASGRTPVLALPGPAALPAVEAPVVVAVGPGPAGGFGRAVLPLEVPGPSRRDVAVPEGGIRIVPSAGWADLVLPEPAVRQLREAVSRVRHGDTVLDDWGFLPGRLGRRGLRLLFCGPPGTGKTLAAEVLAGEVGRELLVVDLSRTVSKWIGETEKNLAAAFDAAERGDYVLLFDEADALFARRTEVGDARDRYANLETAYLLSRLSWFDGVAVLATNLRQNLDVAFGRRLEFVVPFDQPDAGQRRTLWRVHLPAAAPLDDAVDLDQVADFYPLTGALIRNAALAAGYLAAAAGRPIGADQLSHAIHREYLKAGLAYPGPLPEFVRFPEESSCLSPRP